MSLDSDGPAEGSADTFAIRRLLDPRLTDADLDAMVGAARRGSQRPSHEHVVVPVLEATVQAAVVPPVDPAAVDHLTSARLRQGTWWKTVVRMHSALNSPITVSLRALSCSSATVPIDGRISSRSRCSVTVMDVNLPPASAWPHDGVADRAGRVVLIGAAPGPVGPCGDPAALLRQDPADRFDRMTGSAALVRERDDQWHWGSSSPAKKIVARRRMSTSSCRRWTLAWSSLISVSCSPVAPQR